MSVECVEEADVAVASVYRNRIASLAPDQPECRILIVEDQVMNWLLLHRILKKAGFQTRLVEDGAACADLFQSWRPHLIWMDIRMKGMDGLAATRRIRAMEGGHDVKIVALTASAFTKERDEIMAAGMDDFIRKPYRPEEIFDCMARHLGIRFLYEEARPSAPAQLAETQKKLIPTDIKILDLDAARKTTGNDDKLLRELLKLFIDQYPMRVDEMRKAKNPPCADMARRAAHTLKGMAEIIGGKRLSDMAMEAENEFAEERLGRLGEWIETLDKEAKSLVATIDATLK